MTERRVWHVLFIGGPMHRRIRAMDTPPGDHIEIATCEALSLKAMEEPADVSAIETKRVRYVRYDDWPVKYILEGEDAADEHIRRHGGFWGVRFR